MNTNPDPVSGLNIKQSASLTGWSLLVLVASIMLQNITLQVVAGQPLGPTADGGAISSYYGHDVLKVVLWIALPLGLFFLPFMLGFRHYLLGHTTDGLQRFLVDVAVVLGIVEMPLLIAELGQQLGLVHLATHGASPASLVALYSGWHWVYNGVLEWVEVGWMTCFAVVSWRSGAFPRWITGLGFGAAALLLFNEVVAITGISQQAKGPTYVAFLAWMLTTAFYLVRGGTARQQT